MQSEVTHPEFLQTSEMGKIFYSWNVICADVQRAKLHLWRTTEYTGEEIIWMDIYIMFKPFYSCHSVVTQVQLLQLHQTLKTFKFSYSVRL